MKPSVILGILCAVLAGVLYLRHNNANRTLAGAVARENGFSNEVAQLQTKLLLAQGQAVREQTNREAAIHRRAVDLLNASNRVVQIQGVLAATQKEVTKARTQLQTQSVRVGELENQRDELNRKIETLQPLQPQLEELRKNLAFVIDERDKLMKESELLRLELAGLQRNVTDLDYLRLQTVRIEDNMEAAKRMASAKPGARPDLKLPIVMEPDGSVRLASPTNPVGQP